MGGGAVWPRLPAPQQATVPVTRSPQLKSTPLQMDTRELDKLGGTLPASPRPQHRENDNPANETPQAQA